MAETTERFIAANRANWNDRAPIHAADDTGFYGIDTLLAGGTLLTPIESAEIGDVTGLRIAHFQCHIGTDTLSLKRLGASEIIGLDFSEAAIAEARTLATRTGLDAKFVLGSVFDAPTLIGSGFDLVYTTWGTLCWLPDLPAWARAIAAVLKPGGRFYFADSHPFMSTFEDALDGGIAPRFNYGTPVLNPQVFDGGLTYTGSPIMLQHKTTYEWLHSASHVINSLIEAGLAIEKITEHNAIPWQMFQCLEPTPDRLYRLPEGHPTLPLAWSISARKL